MDQFLSQGKLFAAFHITTEEAQYSLGSPFPLALSFQYINIISPSYVHK